MSIIITDLCKTFDDNEVLKNVNITLKDNSIYCLMGSSGIGKTTLLRILMGLERADSGSVSGIDTKSISCMFQEDRLIPYLSAIDNVRIVLHGKNNRDEIRNNLLSILPDNSLDIPVSSLSGGMKRRVALARALSYPGKLIILDEPFNYLIFFTEWINKHHYFKSASSNYVYITYFIEKHMLKSSKIRYIDVERSTWRKLFTERIKILSAPT